jgi:hypothetical protein
MPSLRIRRDGQPYVIASYRDEDEATGFSTWYPDLFAIGQFQAIGIDEGGSFDWELFHELRKGGHLVLGNEGIPRRNIAEVESFRSLDSEIQAYFRYIREDASPDYRNITHLFKACLGQVQRTADHTVRETQFFAVAEGVKELINSGASNEEKREFAIKCRNRLIRRTPEHLGEKIRKYFGLDEDAWCRISNIAPMESSPHSASPEKIAVDPDNGSMPVSEVISRSGLLNQLGELLRYAYEQDLVPGNHVEIEVRVTRR